MCVNWVLEPPVVSFYFKDVEWPRTDLPVLLGR